MTQPIGWPHDNPFPESLREPTPGAGADFPASAGGREQGKFRPAGRRGLTAIAVTDAAGLPLGRTTDDRLDELALYLRAIALGLSMLVEEDLIEQAQ
jgi:hypothetical protein